MMIFYLKLQRNASLVSLIVFSFFFFVYFIRLLEYEKGRVFLVKNGSLMLFYLFFAYYSSLIISANVFYLVSSVAFNTTLCFQQLHFTFIVIFISDLYTYTCMHPAYYYYYYYCILVKKIPFCEKLEKGKRHKKGCVISVNLMPSYTSGLCPKKPTVIIYM